VGKVSSFPVSRVTKRYSKSHRLGKKRGGFACRLGSARQGTKGNRFVSVSGKRWAGGKKGKKKKEGSSLPEKGDQNRILLFSTVKGSREER